MDRVKKAGRKEPAAFGRGDEDYKRMLERDDIDIVIIATPWEWHTRMCVDAMNAGKHAFTEVPAALTIDECWQLVDTAEKTQKHCMMMENCCYGREELFCLNLCRLGLLGELLHGEAAYLHDLRGQMNEVQHGTGSWRTWHYAKRNGNLYPTHGLGPVAQYMGINRGDRFDYLSSVSSPAVGRPAFAKSHFPPDHQWNKIAKWNCGDMCTTIIKTALGRTIMVAVERNLAAALFADQPDPGQPRDLRRLSVALGDRGRYSQCATNGWKAASWKSSCKKYEHPLWKKMGELAAKGGGHGGMDWLMAWRMVDCLHRGEPLDQDVYDAAAWSSVGPLSEKSIATRSQSVDVPDFTPGPLEVDQAAGDRRLTHAGPR